MRHKSNHYNNQWAKHTSCAPTPPLRTRLQLRQEEQLGLNVWQRRAAAVQVNRYLVGQVWFQDGTGHARVAHVIAGLAPQDGQTLADGGKLGRGALYHQIAC